MITITDYGVKLVQLSQDKIELVRQWRNSDKIKKYMEYRDYITPEMQQKWFDKISNTTNDFFFLIIVNNIEVGLINIKDIDWGKRTGESGIFIWDDSCLHKGISYRAALCQRDFAFNVLHLEYISVHILNTNVQSINYNKKFGFELSYNDIIKSDKEVNQLYILTKESYLKHRQKIMNYINSRYKNTPHRFRIGLDLSLIIEKLLTHEFSYNSLAA